VSITDRRIERLLRTDEVAEVLGISIRQVHRLVEDGRLECVSLGHRTRRYPVASVEALITPKDGGESQ
jgi:excisionase family DNA binding protein